MSNFASLSQLAQRVERLASCASPSEVFKALLEGASLAAPRASVYLIRQGQYKGWGSVGFPREAAQLHRGQGARLSEGWLGRVAGSASPLHETEPTGHCPDFGQPAAAECAGFAVRVKGRPIALLVLERAAGEEAWQPEAMRILVHVAELRLDLDLARRKLVAEPVATTQEPAQSATGTATPVGLAPARAEPVASTDSRMDAARRFARLVATDIRLYNEEAVVLGRKQADLGERLSEPLARGRESFLRRHGDLGPAALQILHDAYVQVLAGGDESLLPVSVLD